MSSWATVSCGCELVVPIVMEMEVLNEIGKEVVPEFWEESQLSLVADKFRVMSYFQCGLFFGCGGCCCGRLQTLCHGW